MSKVAGDARPTCLPCVAPNTSASTVTHNSTARLALHSPPLDAVNLLSRRPFLHCYPANTAHAAAATQHYRIYPSVCFARGSRPEAPIMSNQSILRITRELHEIQNGSDLSLAVAWRDVDVRHVRALIVGPPDTPYEFGFFEFTVKFGREYPTKAPSVLAITTNGGRTRFNPNIYAAGKVCLSILG